jgi:ribosomal protein L11 methyltransferase
MELWEIRAEVPAGAAEQTELALLEYGVEGWTLLEDAIAKRAWIVGVFQGEPEARAQWSRLLPLLPVQPQGKGVARRLPDADWRHSYREHFKAWTFGRLHWVPVWERDSFRLPHQHSVLWLDPGMAFGTGNHETTRLCIERLVEFEASLAGGAAAAQDIQVVDAGCGSGILALSASILGFRDVRAFDNDPEAVRVSLENAEINGISGKVQFATAGLPEGLPLGQAGVVLANIQADVLIRYARELVGAVAEGGLLAMSGILAREMAAVRDAFASEAPGGQFDSRTLGEWCDVCLRRPGRLRKTAPASSG